MVIQETVSVLDPAGTERQKEEGRLSSIGKANPAPLVHPYQPPVSYSQRLAWAKLFQLESKFARFLDVLRQIYADTPSLVSP